MVCIQTVPAAIAKIFQTLKFKNLSFFLISEGKKLRILRSLPFLFSPITAVKKNKKQWRPSRAESADGVILHVKVGKNILFLPMCHFL